MEKLYNDILALLKEDGRFTVEKMAKILGAAETDVKSAVSAMEKSGVIVKYSVLINDGLLERDTVEALIEVRVSPQRSLGFDAIAEEICKFTEVRSCYLMSGAYDLAVTVEGRTLKEVALFVSSKLSAMDAVLSTATHFILKRYKDDGANLTGGKELKRLAVHA